MGDSVKSFMAVFPPPTIWTKEKWSVMLTLAMTHFCNGMVVSLQAPFYPEEAEKKEASGTVRPQPRSCWNVLYVVWRILCSSKSLVGMVSRQHLFQVGHTNWIFSPGTWVSVNWTSSRTRPKV